MAIRYEVQTWTAVSGWENCWHENDQPLTFETEAEAQEALDEFFYDLGNAPAEMAAGYDEADYRIAVVESTVPRVDVVTIDSGDTPETMAAKLQRSLSTIELRDLIDCLADLYEPTDDMRERGESLYPVVMQ